MRLDKTIENCKNIHNDEYYKNLDYSILKVCSTCNINKSLKEYNKHAKQPDGFCYRCRDCMRKTNKLKILDLAQHKSRAKRRNLEFNINLDDLFLPTHCPILGIELTYGANSLSESSASIDRIDNSKGYIKGNVIIMSNLANAMKNKASFKQIRNFSSNIIKLIDYFETQGALGSVTDVFPNLEKFSLDS